MSTSSNLVISSTSSQFSVAPFQQLDDEKKEQGSVKPNSNRSRVYAIKGATETDAAPLADLGRLTSLALYGVVRGAEHAVGALRHTTDGIDLAQRGFDHALEGLSLAAHKSADKLFEVAETVTDAVIKIRNLPADEIPHNVSAAANGVFGKVKGLVYPPSPVAPQQSADSHENERLFLYLADAPKPPSEENPSPDVTTEEAVDPWVVIVDPQNSSNKSDE